MEDILVEGCWTQWLFLEFEDKSTEYQFLDTPVEILLCDGFLLELNHLEKRHVGLHGHVYDAGEFFSIYGVVISDPGFMVF